MTDRYSSKATRKQRRRAAARRGKERRSGVRTAWAGPDPELLTSIGNGASRAALSVIGSHLGLGKLDLNRSYMVIEDVMCGTRVVQAATACTALIPFAAQALLHAKGVESRVVAGAAVWSVGPGELDTLDHGMAQSFGPEGDAALGNYHTWLDIGGHLCDFGARFLPQKLEDTHIVQPFTTPRAQWRRFPETILHPAGAPMGNPLTDPHAAYRYAEGPPRLLQEVHTRLAPMLRDLQGCLG